MGIKFHSINSDLLGFSLYLELMMDRSMFQYGFQDDLGLFAYWKRHDDARASKAVGPEVNGFWDRDVLLLNRVGLGLEQTLAFLYQQRPTYELFVDWVFRHATAFQSASSVSDQYDIMGGEWDGNVVSEQDLLFFQEHGYLVVKNAVSRDDCAATIAMIAQHLNIDLYNPGSWYEPHPLKKGIMVQLFQDPLLESNRRAERVRRSFEELWQTKDIIVNTDRVGFNPPVRHAELFGTHRLHWDVDFSKPLDFGLQGILYLNDVSADQGAFQLVPGFHRCLGEWLANLAPGTDPQAQDLETLGAVLVAADAGDLIIWHHHLPHGSTSNHTSTPRWVQYINYQRINQQQS